MGTAGTSTDETLVSRTRCPECRTVFEISPELLASADTRVRCGECFGIFDALVNLLDPDEPDGAGSAPAPSPGEDDGTHAPGTRATERGGVGSAADEADDVLSRPVEDADAYDAGDSFDVTYSDFDLFSGDAELPEVAYLDDTADTATFELDAVPEESEPGAAELEAEPEAASGSGSVSGTGTGTERQPEQGAPVEGADAREATIDSADDPHVDGAPADELEPASPFIAPGETAPVAAFDDPIERPPDRSGAWALRAAMALALVALLGGLYLYRERERLYNDPLGRPLLTLACAISGCQVPSRVDLAALTLLAKEVFTHPTVEGALVINVTVRNTAEFAQRYPVMIVRLRDRTGRTVAELDFPPEDYLDDWSAGDTLAAGRRLDITLEVDDPGAGAESYEFEFREADA